MNEIAIATPGMSAITYSNKTLNTATQRVFKIGETVRKCAYETAVIIAYVNETECFKDDGFNSVHEWTESAFGFKKTASYALLKIGKEYVRKITDGNGKVKGYKSNLLPEESEKDFSTTQIEKMLPAGHAFAAELVERGEVTPDMTCREISKVIKSYMSDDVEQGSSDEDADCGEESTEVESINDKGVTVTMTEHGTDVIIDNGIDTWIIPKDVFDKYRGIKG